MGRTHTSKMDFIYLYLRALYLTCVLVYHSSDNFTRLSIPVFKSDYIKIFKKKNHMLKEKHFKIIQKMKFNLLYSLAIFAINLRKSSFFLFVKHIKFRFRKTLSFLNINN